jgi:hypothetical protein
VPAASPLWDGGLLVALVLLTHDSVRWLPYLALAAAATLAKLAGEQSVRWTLPRGIVALAALAACGGMLVRRGGAPFAVGEDATSVPRAALAFAASHGLRGRVVNCFDLGGYILWSAWPDIRVLVDGRNEIVYPPDFVVRSLRAEHDAETFRAMRQEDHADWAIGINDVGVGYGFLARDPAWAMVYWSDAAVVYARRDAHPELSSLFFAYIDPNDVPGSAVLAVQNSAGAVATLKAIRGEIERLREASPTSVRANLALAYYDHFVGPAAWPERDVILRDLLELTHDDATIAALARTMGYRAPQ